MEVHKPKPWHGLREFLKEYVIIVVGVLTALGAEQTAEMLHGRHVIHEAEAAMRSELLDDDLPQAYVRMAIAPCLVQDLGRLRAAVDQKMPPEQFGALAKGYFPQFRTWDQDAWKAAGASGAAARMDGDRLLKWSTAYVQIPFLQTWSGNESDAFFRLSRSRYRAGAWTPQKVDEVSDILDELQTLGFRMAADSGELLVKARASGLELPTSVQTRLIAEARKVYGGCIISPDLRIVAPLQEMVTSREQFGRMKKAIGVPTP